MQEKRTHRDLCNMINLLSCSSRDFSLFKANDSFLLTLRRLSTSLARTFVANNNNCLTIERIHKCQWKNTASLACLTSHLICHSKECPISKQPQCKDAKNAKSQKQKQLKRCWQRNKCDTKTRKMQNYENKNS